MKKYSIVIIFFAFFIVPAAGQTDKQIIGHVVDSWNGKDVSFCTIWEAGNPQNATIANINGKFSLPLADKQKNSIKISSIGFHDTVIVLNNFNLNSASLLIKLTPRPSLLQDVVVSAPMSKSQTIGFTELIKTKSTLWKDNLTMIMGTLSEGGIYLEPNEKYRGRLTSISFYLPTDFQHEGDVLVRIIEPFSTNLKGMQEHPYLPTKDKATQRLTVINPKLEIPDHVDPPFRFMLTHHSGMLTHLFFVLF